MKIYKVEWPYVSYKGEYIRSNFKYFDSVASAIVSAAAHNGSKIFEIDLEDSDWAPFTHTRYRVRFGVFQSTFESLDEARKFADEHYNARIEKLERVND